MFGSVNCDHLIIRLPYRLRFSEVSGPSIPRILSFWYRFIVSFLVERAHPFQKGTNGKWKGVHPLGKGKEKGKGRSGNSSQFRRAQGRSVQGVDLVTVVNFLNRLLLRLVAHEVIEEIARTVLVTNSATQP